MTDKFILPTKSKDEENHELVNSNQAQADESDISINQNLLMKCIGNNTYCLSLMDYMKKIYHFSQIDFYSAYIQIIYCFKPQELNELSRIRKHLKNQWARDDPGFIMVMMFNILVTSLAYAFCFDAFKRFIPIFFIQFFLFGIIFGVLIAFTFRNIIEAYFRNEDLSMSMSKLQKIELFYSFDIHCNSFVPFYFCTTVIQLILMPLILPDTFISLIISNFLYTIGFCAYFITSSMGYLALPFVSKNIQVKKILRGIVFVMILLTILKVNLSHLFIGLYIN